MHLHMNSNEIIFQNKTKSITVLNLLERGYVMIELNGRVDKEDYKHGFQVASDTMAIHRGHNLVINASKLGQTDPEARAWLMRRLMPETMKRLGHMNVCVVLPQSVFQKMAINLVVKAAKALRKPINIKLFESTEEATEWQAA